MGMDKREVNMKILVIGKEGRLQNNTEPGVYARHEFVYVPMGTEDKAILAAGGDAEIIIVDAMGRVSADLINGMPRLKLIHSEGVGFQGVDIAAAKEKHVYVCNCKGMNATAVAEQAILLMLGLLRGVVTGDRAVREGRQISVKENHMLTGDLAELADCTIGFVGFGDIAKAAAKMADVFGAKTVYYDVFRVSQAVEEEYKTTYLPLEELLAASDIVSLHLPVTPQTAGMVNADFFSRMKKGAYLINTARGELVDSEALITAIRSGKLAGAGLDCVAGEPVAADNVILQAEADVEDKIIYSCHVGGITASSFKRGYQMLWDDIAKVEAGVEPEHIVNRW